MTAEDTEPQDRRARALTERLTHSERDRSHGPVTVRDAASLIIYDEKSAAVLMGRRSARHVFMPNRFVFPGGRVDPADSRVPVSLPYHPATARRLAAETSSRTGTSRLKAFGVAAFRETYEETGVLVGRRAPGEAPKAAAFMPFAERGLALDLSLLTFVARAVTPPGRPRRYDTRFFVVPRVAIADIDEGAVGADAELEEIAWVPMKEAAAMPLPTITLTVLDELAARLNEQDGLFPNAPVPFYRWQRGGFTRTLL
ncbi:MAG: NUDIX hydrolase [Pseudomonadota bacterium]